MFSGFNELALIAVIAMAVFFLPGLLAKGRQERTPRHTPQPVSWQVRLSIVGALVWIAAASLLFKPWAKDPVLFLCFGAGPVLLGAGFFWVIQGYRAKRKNG